MAEVALAEGEKAASGGSGEFAKLPATRYNRGRSEPTGNSMIAEVIFQQEVDSMRPERPLRRKALRRAAPIEAASGRRRAIPRRITLCTLLLLALGASVPAGEAGRAAPLSQGGPPGGPVIRPSADQTAVAVAASVADGPGLATAVLPAGPATNVAVVTATRPDGQAVTAIVSANLLVPLEIRLAVLPPAAAEALPWPVEFALLADGQSVDDAPVFVLDVHEAASSTAVLQAVEIGVTLPPDLATADRDTAIVLRYRPDPAGGAGSYQGIEMSVDRSDAAHLRLRGYLQS